MLTLTLQVFFVIRFYPTGEEPTAKIEDPDPIMSCFIMDGQDNFLTLSREKHWEFSSLRRAKFSTMAMLVELHYEGSDLFVHNCNLCNKQIIRRFHCTVCEVCSAEVILTLTLYKVLKACVCYFLFFHQMIPFKNYEKCFLFHLKGSFGS